MYKVYAHINIINGKVYIGQTSQKLERRWRDGRGYLTGVFSRAIKRYGWDNFNHIILHTNLTKEQANYFETLYIKFYKAISLSYNITDGGEGTIGDHTPKTEEHRRKIGNALRGKPKSEEAKSKMRANHHHSLDTVIYKYSKDGMYICKYDTIVLAAKDNNVAPTHISRCAKGKRPSAGGYVWKYVKD